MQLNNFDLLRLLAAFQVAFAHSAEYLQVPIPAGISAVVNFFPGVPIFFLISGFLIFRSCENAGNTKRFFANRVLRIYPALAVCFVVSLSLVFVSGYFSTTPVGSNDFLIWSAAQLTFFQFFNPDFLRGYGVGVLNGSLWTISVELQFYVLTPILVYLSRKSRYILPSLFVVFLAVNLWYTLAVPPRQEQSLAMKIFGNSFVPWFYMYLSGALVATSDRLWLRVVINPFYATGAYVLFAAAGGALGFIVNGNLMSPVFFIALSVAVFSAAFYVPGFSMQTLGANDISYGVYIYNMPIVNFLIFTQYLHGVSALIVALLMTMLLGVLSWLVIEKPALRLKKTALRRF